MDDKGSRKPRDPDDPEPEIRASRTPYLHVRTVEGLLFEEAIAITGNAKALLQLRAQIDRALGNETFHPFEEGVYRDVNGAPFEVAVKRARRREEMREPVPKPERTAEGLPWGEKARDAAEEGRGGDTE
jgi:hypothetical protein